MTPFMSDHYMALRLAEKRVWDFWFARDGADYHVFYLQAPQELAGRETRHWHVSIGHAVSQDLSTWEALPDALAPSQTSGDWDDYTTWTGSIFKHEKTWYLYYTGTNHAEKGLVQRIGLATSSDLLHWEKYPQNPLVTTDARWYELLDLNLWHDQAWRDPWVFQEPETGLFHMFLTARANAGSSDERGIIGHAQSTDLIHWDVLPPITSPGDFGYLEVPQLVHIDKFYYLLFSAPARFHSDRHYERTGLRPVTGTHYLIADHPLGPFRFCTYNFLVGEPTGLFYSGKLIQAPDGDWKFMACYQFAPDGSFIGELTDPMTVSIAETGELTVDWQSHQLTIPQMIAELAAIQPV